MNETIDKMDKVLKTSNTHTPSARALKTQHASAARKRAQAYALSWTHTHAQT